MPRVKLILVLHPEGRSGERLRKGGSLALCVRTPTERECALRVHLTRSPNHWGMSGIRAEAAVPYVGLTGVCRAARYAKRTDRPPLPNAGTSSHGHTNGAARSPGLILPKVRSPDPRRPVKARSPIDVQRPSGPPCQNLPRTSRTQAVEAPAPSWVVVGQPIASPSRLQCAVPKREPPGPG